MEQKNFDWKKFIINIDQYISAVLFIAIMVLLFIQVISRYVLGYSFTWAEELSIILFVWMTYMGVSSAVTYRKNLRIDALLDVVPFKVKKAMLIISDVIFIIFNIYLIFPFVELIGSIGNSKTPVVLVIASLKLLGDIYKLAHEDEKRLGASKPSIDLEAMEAEWAAKKAEKEKEAK